MIQRHEHGQPGLQQSEHRRKVNRLEVTEEDIGRGGPAIHHDQWRSVKGSRHFVEQTRLGEVDEGCVRVEPLQCGVLIVAVARNEGQGFVFEKLYKVYCEKALPDATIAVEDQVELAFHRSPGLANLILAMRGPLRLVGLASVGG